MAFLFFACGTQTIESNWSGNDINADGLNDDWPESFLHYNDDLQLLYGISNNAYNINLLIKFKDEKLAHRASILGFTLWLNTDQTLGIQYLDMINRDRFFTHILEQEGPVTTAPVRFGDSQTRMGLNGHFYLLQDGLSTVLNENSSHGVQAAMNEKDGFFCFEYKIQYKSEINDSALLNLINDNIMNVQLEFPGLPEDIRKSIEERRGKRTGEKGMSLSGGGKRHPESGIGGRRANRQSEKRDEQPGNPSEQFEKIIINHKITLAQKIGDHI